MTVRPRTAAATIAAEMLYQSLRRPTKSKLTSPW